MARQAKRLLATLAVVAGVLAITGCGTKTVDGDEVATTVSDGLTQRVGQRPGEVECPPKIEAKVGQKARCTLKGSDGSEIGVTVTMKDDQGKFDYAVDSKLSKPPSKR